MRSHIRLRLSVTHGSCEPHRVSRDLHKSRQVTLLSLGPTTRWGQLSLIRWYVEYWNLVALFILEIMVQSRLLSPTKTLEWKLLTKNKQEHKETFIALCSNYSLFKAIMLHLLSTVLHSLATVSPHISATLWADATRSPKCTTTTDFSESKERRRSHVYIICTPLYITFMPADLA